MSDGTSARREDIDLTKHAVEQYRARSRPALDHADARAELDGCWVTTTCLVKTTITERRHDERARQKRRRTSAKRACRRARW